MKHEISLPDRTVDTRVGHKGNCGKVMDKTRNRGKRSL